MPDVANQSQRHRVHGQNPDSDEPTRPVTQCEDERIVIDDPAIGEQGRASQPVYQQGTEKPEPFNSTIDGTHFRAVDIKSEDHQRGDAASCAERCHHRLIFDEISAPGGPRSTRVMQVMQFTLTFEDSQGKKDEEEKSHKPW